MSCSPCRSSGTRDDGGLRVAYPPLRLVPAGVALFDELLAEHQLISPLDGALARLALRGSFPGAQQEANRPQRSFGGLTADRPRRWRSASTNSIERRSRDFIAGSLLRAGASICGGPPLAARATHLYGSAMHCDRIWRNAHLATLAGNWTGGRRRRPHRLARRAHHFRRPAREAHAELEAAEDHRLPGPLDHAGPHRLPHAPGLRRQSRRTNSSSVCNGVFVRGHRARKAAASCPP